MPNVTQGLFLDSNIKIADKPIVDTTIELIEYNKDQLITTTVKDIEDTKHSLVTSSISWVNIIGLHIIEQFHKIYAIYKVHPIILENIIKSNQRPRVEDYNDYLYITMKMLYREDNKYTSEQISFIIGKTYLLSFQELPKDVFGDIRTRLTMANGRLRNNNVNYLGYCLIEAIINNYESIIEDLRDRLNYAQDNLILQSNKVTIEDLFYLKNDLMYLRKVITPVCEIVHNLIKSENKLIDKDTKIYFRDLLVIVKNTIDNLDVLQDSLMGLFDFYLTNKSNQLNEIMKILTMFSVPFMPLSFLAGLYGMNFDYLPELRYHYSYPILIGIMLIIFISLIVFFKRKKWF